MFEFDFVQGRVVGTPDYHESSDRRVRRLKYRLRVEQGTYQLADGQGNANYLTIVREVRKNAPPLEHLFIKLDRSYIQEGTEVAVVGQIRKGDESGDVELVALNVAYLRNLNPKGDTLFASLASE